MANWNRRLAELQEKYEASQMSDKAFFESPEYRDFTQKAAEDMVNGICGYLRRHGFSITEAEEAERVRSINLEVFHDEASDCTAYTNGQYVRINAGHKLLAPLNGRELRHFGVQGFRVHEIAHVIFSDFPTTMAWLNQLGVGNWWPVAPDGLATSEGQALDAKLKNDPQYRDVVVKIAKHVENSLDDGYIEREVRALYGGLAATELATLNDMLLEDMESFGTQLENNVPPFFAIMNQLLLYAKFDMMMADDCPEEYLDMLEKCMFAIDDVKCERDPQKRVAGVNEILCILYPLLDETVQNMQDKQKQQPQQNQPAQKNQNGQQGQAGQQNQQQQGQQNQQGQQTQQGQQSQQGQAGQQGQQGQPGGQAQGAPMTAEQHDKLVEALNAAAQKAGTSDAPQNRTSGSLANTRKSQNAKAESKVPAGKAAPHDQVSNTPGASLGESDLSAGKWEVDSIQKSAADAQANRQVEAEMKREMQKEAKSVVGGGVSIDRAAEVSAENIARYDRMAGAITAISRNIERRFRTIIRDEENDDSISGLTMGTRLEARLLYHKDGKCFSRKNFPRDTPRLAIGYLADESVSMSTEAVDASIKTGIILEDLCRRMELPCYIGGFTSHISQPLQYISYVEYGSVDAKDKYRLTGMSSRGGTPTGYAVHYMTARLKKLPTASKLLIVSTDGRSNSTDLLQREIKEAQKAGVTVIGAGIGASRDAIQSEFGDAFLDISDMEKMPQLLANIVKRNLLR